MEKPKEDEGENVVNKDSTVDEQENKGESFPFIFSNYNLSWGLGELRGQWRLMQKSARDEIGEIDYDKTKR